MIDHIGIHVKDIERSKAFYTKALAPLGYTILRDFGPHVGMGAGQKPDFWMSEGTGEPNRLHSDFVNGIKTMPVRFTPTRPLED